MSSEFKNALITFGRGLFAAAVGAAANAVLQNYMNPGITYNTLAGYAVTGAIAGVLLFCGQYLRNITTQPVNLAKAAAGRLRAAGPHLTRTRSWADWLPF